MEVAWTGKFRLESLEVYNGMAWWLAYVVAKENTPGNYQVSTRHRPLKRSGQAVVETRPNEGIIFGLKYPRRSILQFEVQSQTIGVQPMSQLATPFLNRIM